MKPLKKILLLLLVGFLCFLAYNFSALRYGIQQGIGQAEVLWNAVPIEKLQKGGNLPDFVLQKFKLIETIKHFAEDSLGLRPTENYTSYYDQHGKPILWVVTASPEFAIEAKEWCFPIAGCFPYKGFFDWKKAEKEEQFLHEQGYDTEIDEVNAWSTLGWFKDPVLSSMLERSAGSLANLIIHESTHATLYVKDSVQFNENLASFIGRKGAEQFLKHHFGLDSDEYKSYTERHDKRGLFSTYMRSAIAQLDSLYNTLPEEMPLAEKRTRKATWIQELKEGLLRIEYYADPEEGRKRLEKFQPNNAYFSGFSTYARKLPELEKQLDVEFNGNLKEMIIKFKNKYQSL
jgi:predicted aminopeptidase